MIEQKSRRGAVLETAVVARAAVRREGGHHKSGAPINTWKWWIIHGPIYLKLSHVMFTGVANASVP